MADAKKKSKKELTDYELALALSRDEEYNPVGITENAVFPSDRNKENYEPRTLVDQTLEIIDPTPNIFTLFMQFNKTFFWNKLLSVEVKWSPRMTSCAGVCSFRPRSRDCVISLSAPLLKLRPRKDLVETLLHEMIHGYLFLTNNNRDRDGHGPEFCKHMDRINREAGTHITIYHTFHEEVKLYQQHWWRCSGPCQKNPPYFGTVRRAMNRAPGPNDFWWAKHQQNCGGEFVKIREPEKSKPKSKSQRSDDKTKPAGSSAKGKADKNLDDFFAKPRDKPKSAMTMTNGSLVSGVKPSSVGAGAAQPSKYPAVGSGNYKPPNSASGSSGNSVSPAGLVKLGTNTNKVHGWGTGGPGSSSGASPKLPKSSNTIDSVKSPRTVSFSGTVGGQGTGRSNLLDKYSSTTSRPNDRPLKKQATIDLDTPSPKKPKLESSSTAGSYPVIRFNNPDVQELINCPNCDLALPPSIFNDHLDKCLFPDKRKTRSPRPCGNKSFDSRDGSAASSSNPGTSSASAGSSKSAKVPSPIEGQTNLDAFVVPPTKTAMKHFPCPVCSKPFEMDLLNEHLDKCLLEPKESEKTEKPKSVLRIEGPRAGPSTAIEPRDDIDLTNDIAGTGKPYVCLVCNAKIRGDIALNDHLDECIPSVFYDDLSDSEIEGSTPPPKKVDLTEDKFPCPICMKLIAEKGMNEHLDTCLSGQDWS